jgi:hypothetical protein
MNVKKWIWKSILCVGFLGFTGAADTLTVTGTIMGGAATTRLNGAIVVLTYGLDSNDMQDTEATTDSQGDFLFTIFSGVPSITISISATGYTTVTKTFSIPLPNNGAADLVDSDFVLIPLAMVKEMVSYGSRVSKEQYKKEIVNLKGCIMPNTPSASRYKQAIIRNTLSP